MERKDSCEELIDGPLVTSVSQDLKRCLSAIPHQIPVLRVLFILERDGTFWNYHTEVIYFFLRHTNETALFNNLLWFLRLNIQFQRFFPHSSTLVLTSWSNRGPFSFLTVIYLSSITQTPSFASSLCATSSNILNFHLTYCLLKLFHVCSHPWKFIFV